MNTFIFLYTHKYIMDLQLHFSQYLKRTHFTLRSLFPSNGPYINIFLGNQSLYRRCPNLQGMESDFLRRNGAFVATRARVELVHVRGAGAGQHGWGNLNAHARTAWQPLPSLATVGDTAVNPRLNSRIWTMDAIVSFSSEPD